MIYPFCDLEINIASLAQNCKLDVASRNIAFW